MSNWRRYRYTNLPKKVYNTNKPIEKNNGPVVEGTDLSVSTNRPIEKNNKAIRKGTDIDPLEKAQT